MVTKLQKNVESKDKQIQMLENKIDQLEQYTRLENIIITGLKTNHKSWSRRVMITLLTLSNDKGQIDVILLDFLKAFDGVTHHCLLMKLYMYGITGKTHRWIRFYSLQ